MTFIYAAAGRADRNLHAEDAKAHPGELLSGIGGVGLGHGASNECSRQGGQERLGLPERVVDQDVRPERIIRWTTREPRKKQTSRTNPVVVIHNG